MPATSNIANLREGVKDVAGHMEHVAEHSAHASTSVGQMIKSLIMAQGAMTGVAHVIHSLAGSYPGVSAMVKSIGNVFRDTKSEIQARASALDEALHKIELSNGAIQKGMELEHKRLTAQRQIVLLQAQARESLDRVSGMTKIWVGLLVTGLASARALSARLNQDLIEANSALDYRFSLMRRTLEVQRQTGESFEDITEAAKALVHYGMDERETFADNLKYVTMLKEGIGLSTQTSGQLATIWERQLGQSFKRAADMLAQIVNSTALAADEAGRLATNIARAVGAMRAGVSSDLSGVIKMLSGYESQLKKLGGEAGQFAELLTKMTRSEGLVGASILGVSNPEFLASEQASKAVLKRFGSYVNSFLADTQGWERQLRLEALAEQFGMSAEQINLMARAVREHTGAVDDNISIEERYREQVVATGRSLATLGNKFKAVLMEALLPLLQGLTAVVDVLTKVVGWLAQFKGTVYVVMTGFLVTLPFVIREIYILTAALVKLAWAARAAAISSLGGTGGAGTGLLAGLRAAIVSGLGALTIPLTLTLAGLVVAIGGLVTVLFFIGKYWKDIRNAQKDASAARASYEAQSESLLTSRMVKIFLAARRGDEDDIRENVVRMLNYAGAQRGSVFNGTVMTDYEVNKLKAQLSAEATALVTKAGVTQRMSEQSFVRTKEEEALAVRQDAISDEMVKGQSKFVEELRSATRNTTRIAEEQEKQRILEAHREDTWTDILKAYPLNPQNWFK